MRKLGLRAKVIIFVSCLVMAVIAINAAIFNRTERVERERQLMEQGRLFARLTATDVVRTYGSLSWTWSGPGVGPGMGKGPAADQDEQQMQMARFFSYYPDLTRLMVITDRGQVLYDSEAAGRPGPAPARVDDPEFMKRLSLPDMDEREITGQDGKRFLDILAPVAGTGGPQFIKVRYIISFLSLEKRLSAIRKEFLLLAGFFIMAGVIVATGFSAKLVNPILRLKDGAGEIARGNLDHKVDVSSTDEIGELARSFNQMADSVRAHRRDLEEANKSLTEANDELKVLQKELIRSERMAAVGQLAAGLSHEIDNPIGVILGFAELLLEDMPEDDPRREDLLTIVEESKRCKRIVRGLLDFSRPPALGVVRTKVAEVVRRTVESARSQRLFKKVRLRLDLDDAAPEIMADPDRLKQVFMNLLLNSVQAMPEGGEINVRSCYDGESGRVTVTFKDNGPGIPPEHMEKVFDPFFTTKRPGEGTGLGLAICVRLLEEQGGTVSAESEPGKGATFTVTLPVSKELEERTQI